jgi:hypothetical protein
MAAGLEKIEGIIYAHQAGWFTKIDRVHRILMFLRIRLVCRLSYVNHFGPLSESERHT